MQSYESEVLTVEVGTYGELLLYPLFIVRNLSLFAEVVRNAIAFATNSREHEVEVCATACELILECDDIALLQRVLGLEEVEIFVGSIAGDTYGRTSEVSVVPCEVGFESCSRNISSGAAEEFRCKPPAPCRQIVLKV